MKDYPNSFWAAVFIILACALAVIALFSPTKDTAAVITMASSIITGAFGYIQGVKDGQTSISVPSQPSPNSVTTVTTGTPQQPVGPA